MLVGVTTDYKFEGGPGYVVGGGSLSVGAKIKVNIPSIMGSNAQSGIEQVDPTGMFLNPTNTPSVSHSMKRINYLTCEVTESLVVDRSNKNLLDSWDGLHKALWDMRSAPYVPRSVGIGSGEMVQVKTNLHTLVDLYLEDFNSKG